MNQPLFLHIVERLEGFLTKLPEKLQKPILHELTPLKELFLKQRPPRLVLTGSHKLPVQEVFAAIFPGEETGAFRDVLVEVFRWQEIAAGSLGKVSLLDARGADAGALAKIKIELERQAADAFLHLADAGSGRSMAERETENLAALLSVNDEQAATAKVIGVSLVPPSRGGTHVGNGHAPASERSEAVNKLRDALANNATIRPHVARVLEIPVGTTGTSSEAARLLALLAQVMPNEARVEMVRISKDREAQAEIAQVLVKSTSAMCAAIGAQPIPLADLPILTTLQLVMVSGIMYLTGRERSLRAATEFVAALGVNVGAGMVLREGTRAVLKFFPGWGNVVCGMVAGAGTYALGRAAIVYFVEGLSLKDARRIYLRSRKPPGRPRFLTTDGAGKEGNGRS